MYPLATLAQPGATATVTPTATMYAGTVESSTTARWFTAAPEALGCLLLFLVLFWLSLLLRTWRDSRLRTHDLWLRMLSVGVVALLPGGLVAYLLLRPPETHTERESLALEQAALQARLAECQRCPQCQMRVEPDFQVCPSCGAWLKRPCPTCGRLLPPGWAGCPYCVTPLARPAQRSQPGMLTVLSREGRERPGARFAREDPAASPAEWPSHPARRVRPGSVLLFLSWAGPSSPAGPGRSLALLLRDPVGHRGAGPSRFPARSPAPSRLSVLVAISRLPAPDSHSEAGAGSLMPDPVHARLDPRCCHQPAPGL